MAKLKVSILGATGMIGQHFIHHLENHPWFVIEAVAASDRSVGMRYGDAMRTVHIERVPKEIAELKVCPIDPKAVGDVDVAFSALPAEVAGKIEEDFAKAGITVISTARSHRMDSDVPILIPEINADHISLIDEQHRRRGWDGAIVTEPNCTAAALVMPLKPIHEGFGIESVIVSSMQAVSGAGYPGVASLDIIDNVLPFIKDEEEKVEAETLKILGTPRKPAEFKVSASCHRVPVLDGHTEAVFVGTKKAVEVDEVVTVMNEFRGEPQELKLPSAPEQPIVVRSESDRPQPRLDRMTGKGMSVVVGRVRKDPVLNGIKFIVVGHNTIRGGAGNSVLSAELLKVKGYL